MLVGNPGRLKIRLLTSVMFPALVAGCVTTSEREVDVQPQIVHEFLADKPEELRDHFYVMLAQSDRNKVLNDMRLGLASFEMGRTDLAEQLFDDSLLRIESIYADNEKAKQARQLFVKERTKDFKGEPYERVMAYFYRGLLYMSAGDYENARATFLGGMLQDAFADEDQNRADFGLMAFLQGWAARCAGNSSLANEDFKEFQEIRENAPTPKPSDNVLILVETGQAPVKYSATDPQGTKPRYLKFTRGTNGRTAQYVRVNFPEPGPKSSKKIVRDIQKTGRNVDAFMIEDLFYQASSRGGREFDSILAGKTQFKDTANTVGNVAMVGAGVAAGYALQRNDRDAAIAAGVMLLAAAIAKSAAEAAEPDADTRYWDNLSDKFYAATLTLPQSVQSVGVDFLDFDKEVYESRQVDILRAGNCGLGWMREHPAFPSNPRAPYSAPDDQMLQAVVIPPLPEEPVVAEANDGTPNMETGAGEGNTSQSDSKISSIDRLKNGFMELFSTKPAAAATSEDPQKNPAE